MDTIESYWIPSQKKTKSKLKNLPKFQIFEFWNKHSTGHTWSCLIKCANMKWIRWVLLKIQSGHDSVHRRIDGQTDQGETSIPHLQLRWSGGYNEVFKLIVQNSWGTPYEIVFRWMSQDLTNENMGEANIGSGNGLVPSGNNPLPKPMLTQIYVIIWHH